MQIITRTIGRLAAAVLRRDLSRVREAGCALSEGKLDTRVYLNADSPLHPFGEAFNSMAGRLAVLMASHKELTNAVSHELRHPLMRLRFRHALVREAVSPDERSLNLDRMSEDLDLLDRLADELLTYAQLERAEPEVRLEKLQVAPWLAAIERQGREMVGARGDDLALEFRVGAIELRAEPRYLARAVGNLLSNAIRFASHKIRVTVESDPSGSRIHVDDDGPGVPTGAREQVFEPFWRGDASRDRKAAGFGIGLALVRRIARWHGGDATVGESALGGARFTISW